MDLHRLRNWNQIAINKDTHGKLLMGGNQTMTAIALGMIGQDQFPEFNEIMKAVMLQPIAQQLKLSVKAGYKDGIVRIWQKMAEYEHISALKILHHKVQVWLYVTALCIFTALCSFAVAYGLNTFHDIDLL